MKEIDIKLGLFALGLLLAFSATAQTGPRKVAFSLAEAQQYAVEHNRTLASASLDVQKAQATKWKTIAGMLPQVSASGTYSNSLGYKMDLGPMQISMPPYATFNISTAVGLSGAQIVSLGIANISRRMADITLEKNLESMKKLLKITQNSVDVGVAEQTDADQLQVQVSTMESTIKTTQRSLEMVYNSLRLQLCLEEDVDIVLTQGIDDLLNMNTTSELLASPFDINDNYDYRLLKENTELVRKQIALTGWSNGPTVSVYHQYNARHNFSNEATMNMTPPNMLGAQVNIPLFTFGKNYAAIKEAKLTYKKQLNTLEDTELSLNVQYRQLLYNLRNAIEKYEIQKQNVDVAQRVFDNIAKKYEFGVASSLDVTNSGTNLISAQSTYVQSLLEIVNAQISLEQLLNK